MVDLDSGPGKPIDISDISEIGKQLPMTRGSLNTFSHANDVPGCFAILPGRFAGIGAASGEGPLAMPDIMRPPTLSLAFNGMMFAFPALEAPLTALPEAAPITAFGNLPVGRSAHIEGMRSIQEHRFHNRAERTLRTLRVQEVGGTTSR